jgi:hypothetical protein
LWRGRPRPRTTSAGRRHAEALQGRSISRAPLFFSREHRNVLHHHRALVTRAPSPAYAFRRKASCRGPSGPKHLACTTVLLPRTRCREVLRHKTSGHTSCAPVFVARAPSPANWPHVGPSLFSCSLSAALFVKAMKCVWTREDRNGDRNALGSGKRSHAGVL